MVRDPRARHVAAGVTASVMKSFEHDVFCDPLQPPFRHASGLNPGLQKLMLLDSRSPLKHAGTGFAPGMTNRLLASPRSHTRSNVPGFPWLDHCGMGHALHVKLAP